MPFFCLDYLFLLFCLTSFTIIKTITAGFITEITAHITVRISDCHTMTAMLTINTIYGYISFFYKSTYFSFLKLMTAINIHINVSTRWNMPRAVLPYIKLRTELNPQHTTQIILSTTAVIILSPYPSSF